MIPMVMTMLLSAMGVVREKEFGTMEQIIVTPIRPWQLLVGKLLPFALTRATPASPRSAVATTEPLALALAASRAPPCRPGWSSRAAESSDRPPTSRPFYSHRPTQ